MKIKIFKSVFIAAVFAILSMPLLGSEKKISLSGNLPEVNLNLDKKTAARIAEAVFVRLYGEEILNERPWLVSENDEIFFVKGTMRHSLGGVAKMVINKKNGAIIMCVLEK